MSDKPNLIKADLGPYASRIYKFTLFDEEGYYMENPLKFIHINNDEKNRNSKKSNKYKRLDRSRTVAVLSLSPNAIKKIATDYINSSEDLYILMTVGVQIVSLDDNYNKKVGRDLSVKQMKDVDLKVTGVGSNDDFITVTLETHENINLSLRLNKKTGFSTVYGRLKAY